MSAASKAAPPAASKKILRRRRLALGAIVVAAIALVWALAAGPSTYEVHAVFDRVNGLVEGADVTVAGNRVGEVTTIELSEDEEQLPAVTMRIDSSYDLYEGAVAVIRAPSAAGQVNRVIAIENGEGNSIGEGKELADGATLGLAATEQPVETDQVLSMLDAPTRRDVTTVLAGLDRGSEGQGDAVAKTLRHSASLLSRSAATARQLDADGDALRTALESSSSVVTALAEDPGRLGAAADRVGALLRVTASRQTELAATVENLPGALAEPRAALERLRGSVPVLRNLVADAQPGIEALVPFARELRPAVDAARPVVDDGRRLAEAAPPQMERLTLLASDGKSLLRDLGPALKNAGPVLDEARVRTPDFFSFFANWADFTSLYDVNGHAARVGLVLPPAPNNLIDGSDSGPGSLEKPYVRTPGVLEGEPWEDYRDSFIGGGG